MTEQMLSVAQVAEELGMSGETVRRMIDERQFPNAHKLRPDKLTSPWRIPRSDVDAYERRVGIFQELGPDLAVQPVEGQEEV